MTNMKQSFKNQKFLTKTHDGEIFMQLTIINLRSLWWIRILQNTKIYEITWCSTIFLYFLELQYDSFLFIIENSYEV